MGSAVVLTIILGTAAYLAGPKLLAIYITDSQQAINYGVTRLSYIALPYFLCALMDVTTGALRGMGAALSPMLISVLGVCGIRIFWIYTIFQIPDYHTPRSLYISYAISWVITFIFQYIAFMRIYKKHTRN